MFLTYPEVAYANNNNNNDKWKGGSLYLKNRNFIEWKSGGPCESSLSFSLIIHIKWMGGKKKKICPRLLFVVVSPSIYLSLSHSHSFCGWMPQGVNDVCLFVCIAMQLHRWIIIVHFRLVNYWFACHCCCRGSRRGNDDDDDDDDVSSVVVVCSYGIDSSYDELLQTGSMMTLYNAPDPVNDDDGGKVGEWKLIHPNEKEKNYYYSKEFWVVNFFF